MKELGALVYADLHAALNDARRIVRSPGRLGIWIAYALALGVLVWSRFRFGRFHAGAQVAIAAADYAACGLLTMLVFAFAAGYGASGFFRSRCEARFIIGSAVGAALAIAYLQTRETLARGRRFLFSLVYLIFVLGPRELGVGAAFADLALATAVIVATQAIAMPRRLASRCVASACAAAGIPLGVLAILPAARDALAALPAAGRPTGKILSILPAWHPGQVLLEPNAVWFAGAGALAAAGIAVLAAAGNDAYPELYALSIARIERRESRLLAKSTPAPVVRSERFAPVGVLVFVWKSALEFRRRVSAGRIVGGAALWCVAGFAAARLAARDDALVLGTLVPVVINIIIIVGVTATGTLAAELRRPLFWLAPASLFERLCALALAQIWRTVATLELIAVSFAAGGGSALQTLVLAAGLPGLVAVLAAIGFVTFAFFPSPSDGRGPVAVLRFALSAVLLVPPLVLVGSIAAVTRAPLTALLAAVVLGLVEAVALIGVAAWRLDGRVDRVSA